MKPQDSLQDWRRFSLSHPMGEGSSEFCSHRSIVKGIERHPHTKTPWQVSMGWMRLKIHSGSFSATIGLVVFTLSGGCATRPLQEPAASVQPDDNAINIGKRFTVQ